MDIAYNHKTQTAVFSMPVFQQDIVMIHFDTFRFPTENPESEQYTRNQQTDGAGTQTLQGSRLGTKHG